MRKLLWFALGFGATCAFCAYFRTVQQLILPALVLSAFLGLLSRKFPLSKAALAALGIAAGLFWFCRFEKQVLEPVYAMDGVTENAVIHCSSFPEETDYGCRVDGRLTVGDRDYRLTCYLDATEDVVPGDLLSGPFRFKVTAPGGLKESSYHQGEGIFLLAYQADEIAVIHGDTTVLDRAAGFRQKILENLDAALSREAAGFAKALLLGDSSGLDYQTKTDLTVSGIRHIVAVSGLHVSILFSLIYAACFRRRFLTALLAFPTLLLFAAVTGFTPSVNRACIMAGLMLISMLLNREYDGAAALSFAALILLAVNPLVITSVSYQLSFASVAGIFLFSSRIRKWILSGKEYAGKIFRYFADSVSVTLSATVLTLPLCGVHFGAVSLGAIVTNLLVLWAVGIIFYGLMALCLLQSIWSGGALVLGRLLTVLIRYVLATANLMADFTLSSVYTRSLYITAWMVFAYVLLAVFLMSRNRKPSYFICCTVLGLSFALLASWAEPLQRDTCLTVLDVGQGQCLLVQSEGKTYLVDCGGSSDTEAADTAAETLLSQGISSLDAVILTHYDRDHTGGMAELLSRVDAKLLLLPPVYPEETYPAQHRIYVTQNLVLSCGETEIRIFAGDQPGADNENSICVLFDTVNCDILVTGDRDSFGERSLLRYEDIPDVDVLIAGHHGSKNSTCDELLAAVRPEIVCISAGRGNSFGHPAPELLERLEAFGCTVYRTDLQGNIIIRR